MRELETQRLRLRRLKREDAPIMFANWTSDPDVCRYMTWYAHKSVDDTYKVVDMWLPEYEREDCFRWMIERRSDGELIGMIDVVGYIDGSPAIGYCSGKRFWGNGYMTEAVGAVSAELFAAGYEAVLVEALDANTESNRVIQKCGFEFTGSEIKPVSSVKPEPVKINNYRLDRKK